MPLTDPLIVGAHLPNGPILGPDQVLFVAGRFDGALLLHDAHTPADVDTLRTLRRTLRQVVVRLPDSTWPAAGGGTYIPSFRDYASRCRTIIARFHAFGVLDFQLDNEPNLPSSAWGPDRPWEWQAFMHDVLGDLRQGLPPGVRLGFTPFTHPYLGAWLAAADRVARACDWIACHSYWQAPGDRFSPLFGANSMVLHARWPDKPVIITEWGSSICQTVPPPAPAAITSHMQAEYPRLAGLGGAPALDRGHVLFSDRRQPRLGGLPVERPGGRGHRAAGGPPLNGSQNILS